MLKLRRIRKSYQTGEFIQHALMNIDVTFRKNEFVAILGQSGSGKTTMLNIIGGLDRYDSGDLLLNDKSTQRFKDRDWDAYRNNCIGFIFQSYNLISHISVLVNVEMGMTLSGINSNQRRKKAIEVLERVGLKDHLHKKPNQLSGGQMQRVAIARALVNDPDIILADEPTGALDSETSVQILELIKEISKDKLVIMVTHNPELASSYANRIIKLKDGEIQLDSNPPKQIGNVSALFQIRKTAMSYPTALKLSFHNIITKLGRTILTSFASSIGIIGIALILALSNGFQIEINNYEKDSLSDMPLTISRQVMQMDNLVGGSSDEETKKETYPNEQIVSGLDGMFDSLRHENNITPEYIEYLEKIKKEDLLSMTFQKSVVLNVISHHEKDGYKKVDLSDRHTNWSVSPSSDGDENVIQNSYDVLAGKINDKKPGLILSVNNKNEVSTTTLEQLGFSKDEMKEIQFDGIMEKEVKIILNDQYYTKQNEFFMMNQDLEAMYHDEKSITVKVQAIIRGKESKELITNSSGVTYTSALGDELIERNQNSEVVQLQEQKDYNVLNGKPFETADEKNQTMALLGADATPSSISIYPKNFEAKDRITKYLDDYNKGLEDVDKIHYADMAAVISSLSQDIMSAIALVLIAFSAISLIVSSIMIGIITYISVLERTKEIGILRALGARKKDITRVFNAETMIIGLSSGLLGITLALLFIIPVNMVIERVTNLTNVAQLDPLHGGILITVSLVLTLIGGAIPARLAAKKDPVEALRSE